MASSEHREIPFNYTSADDRQVVLWLLGDAAWQSLERLRGERITGRSARLLWRALGELFLLRRNPFLIQELLDHPKRKTRFENAIRTDLRLIRKHANGHLEVLKILELTETLLDDILNELADAANRQGRIRRALGKTVGEDNVRFDPFSLVSHVTDATDWRLYLPLAVVFPTRETQVAPLLNAIETAGLKAIPRGGGTGLTGGAIPLDPNCIVINLERLNRIRNWGETTGNTTVPWVELEAGVITETAIQAAAARGMVFATDPTSAWASTIGGNIAENAGGKTAVLWGTAVDNLLSWKMALPGGKTIEVTRVDHPLRKIQPDDTLRFKITGDQAATLELRGDQLRKRGLWKDITNKALGGLPGLQKEGCDGVITSARFVLHKPYPNKTTACLEFFGADMKEASEVILALAESFPNRGQATLQALEHFDEEYVAAIGYQAKAARGGRPKAVLLVDMVAHDQTQLAQGKTKLAELLKPYPDTEFFLAADENQAQSYWADRKKLGAIAKRTNAFKLNEDVVLPLNKLAEFAEWIDGVNLDEERHNQIETAGAMRDALAAAAEQDQTLSTKLASCLPRFETTLQTLSGADKDTLRHEKALKKLADDVLEHFSGHATLPALMATSRQAARDRRLLIATHMHAGDGNVHVNIPVFSNDRQMMRRAQNLADVVMRKAVDLGGVVSGEHGIGVTKIAHLASDRLADLRRHRRRLDPGGIMNPHKLDDPEVLARVYTPSFNLLNLEARILQHEQLATLANKIQACVRCGKCKPDCCVFDPARAMFYHPRNKNLAIAAIIEALLYDAQRSQSTAFDPLRHLEDMADHCTVCHKCLQPCPVDIDTGEISLLERRILKNRGMKHTSAATRASLTFLRRSRAKWLQRIFRLFVLQLGTRAQRLAYKLLGLLPLKAATRRRWPATLLASPLPLIKDKTLTQSLPIRSSRQALLFKPDRPNGKTVFYFPGCGSERLHGRVGQASIYILVQAGYHVVLPPAGLCCGFPFGVNAREEQRSGIELRNMMIFSQIREMFGYLEFNAVAVSCGTCMEALEQMKIAQVFHCPTRDVAQLALDAGLEHEQLGAALYHQPCHDSLKKEGLVLLKRISTGVTATLDCCGEAGTLSLSRPDISMDLIARKTDSIRAAKACMPSAQELLSNCPACLQGLGRQEQQGLTVKHLAVKLAEANNKTWQTQFQKVTEQAEQVTF